MGRLILAPQYPTPLRYQEWWYSMFPFKFNQFFNEVLVLGNKVPVQMEGPPMAQFAPLDFSIALETQQIDEYNWLKLREDDTLLLCDLSFPGLFANILFHKRPKKCFAICHATSKNRYDYFQKDRKIKYPIESNIAKLFNKIFVASEYHKEKLGWNNIKVIPFPDPPFQGLKRQKEYKVVSVARKCLQKRSQQMEDHFVKVTGIPIFEPNAKTWEEYYEFLAKSEILLITSKEETYGYQVIDAIKNDCIPLAPNKFSYPELLPKRLLYNHVDDMVWKIKLLLKEKPYIPIPTYGENFYKDVSNIIQNE